MTPNHTQAAHRLAQYIFEANLSKAPAELLKEDILSKEIEIEFKKRDVGYPFQGSPQPKDWITCLHLSALYAQADHIFDLFGETKATKLFTQRVQGLSNPIHHLFQERFTTKHYKGNPPKDSQEVFPWKRLSKEAFSLPIDPENGTILHHLAQEHKLSLVPEEVLTLKNLTCKTTQNKTPIDYAFTTFYSDGETHPIPRKALTKEILLHKENKEKDTLITRLAVHRVLQHVEPQVLQNIIQTQVEQKVPNFLFRVARAYQKGNISEKNLLPKEIFSANALTQKVTTLSPYKHENPLSILLRCQMPHLLNQKILTRKVLHQIRPELEELIQKEKIKNPVSTTLLKLAKKIQPSKKPEVELEL